ncbi:PREDICTED: lymphotactin isoform X1 [Hipposideros armiger]|uniref:Lymphotactin isoform X1 n=1 Tax=Hipposideros armiger TaxID=186990 RepID=A0A8B7RVC4_HIPAR|nr:PREDICTED: lymphotactin isoform X1 [Hipposideros armiger]XP_019503090.1 PREDICTED: lymphotactin isoform X1 [Hipposideros armiger]
MTFRKSTRRGDRWLWRLATPAPLCPSHFRRGVGFLRLTTTFKKASCGTWKPRKCADHGRNKRDPKTVALTVFAQLIRTSAMRPVILALLGFCCLTAYVAEGVGSEGVEKEICVSLTTQRLPLKHIKSYTIKEGPMRAVILITRRGVKVCANPQTEWVKKAMVHVNSKKSTKQTKPTGAQQSTNTPVTLSR